nr:hypothetical protein [Tanacetum cinerariifolium]
MVNHLSYRLHQYQHHHHPHHHHPSLNNVLQIFVKIPTSFIVANNSSEWRQAMKEEYDALIKNGTWSLVPRASNTNVVDVKQILRYLHGTVEHGMLIHRSSGSTLQAFTNVLWKGNFDTSLEAFSNADWLEIQMIDEAEYKDLADIVVELTWLQDLLNELGICSSLTSILWCDNLAILHKINKEEEAMEFKYEEEEEEVIDFEEDFRQVEELTPPKVSSWIGEDGKEMHGVMVINDVLDYPKSKC